MVITFHRTLAGCEAADREAWRVFLRDYTPVVYHLLKIYVPPTSSARQALWQEALGNLAVDDYARLRGFAQQSEREFLMDLRVFLLDQVAPKLDPALDIQDAPRPAKEMLGALLGGLPLLHQGVVFLKMAGYTNATVEKILRITPAVAEAGLERLRVDYSILLERPEDKCLWPAAWAELIRSLRAAKREDCAPLRQFVRIQDGQISWYDKEPVERHISACLHCLERWTALLEIQYCRREVKPLPAAEVETLLLGLPLKDERKKPRSLLKWMFG